jgi:CHAT domain-containing protein
VPSIPSLTPGRRGAIQLVAALTFGSLPVIAPGQAAPPAIAASAADTATYAAGLALIAQLHGDEKADALVLKQVNLDTAQTALSAVMSHGQGAAATPADWTAMHRAVDGLIEVSILRDQIFKASVMSNLQAMLYHNDEQDELASLAASRRDLDLQQRSGVRGTLYICWENIGQSLIRLGRVDEGANALREALAVVDDPNSASAASIWQEYIEVLSGQGNTAETHRQLEAFLTRSATVPSKLYRGRALLTKAGVETAEAHYDAALDSLHSAMTALKGDEHEAEFKFEVLLRLLTVGSAAMDSAPYPEAKALCERMDKEFPGMPISVSGFAHQVLNHRRRLNGEFDALLREETAALSAARSTNDVPSTVDALLALAVDYEYLNEKTQAIASLEEAMALMKAAPPAAITSYQRFRVMLVLANAYLEKKDAGHAGALFAAILQEIDAMQEGTAKQRARDAYAQAQLGKARVAALDDDPDTARDIFDKALHPRPGQFGRYTRSDVLLQAARLERDAKEKPAEAVRLYMEAIAEYHAQKDLRTEVSARLQLARFLATDAARLPGAQENAIEQVRLARIATSSIALADARWRLEFVDGILAQNAGHNDAAIASFRRAIDELDKIRSGLSQGEQRQSFLDDDSAQELYRRLATLLTTAGQRDAAWDYVERDKARTFLESLRGHKFAPAPTAASSTPEQKELASLEQQILSARVALSPQNEAALRGAEVVQTRLHTLETKFALARQQAGLAQTRATQPLSLKPLRLADIQKLLPARTVLVEYTVLESSLAAFVVSRSSAAELHWEVDTRSLPAALRQFHDALASPDGADGLQTQMREMSELIFGPIARALPPGTDSLLIVPAQGLAYIPFQALLLPDGKQVLDRYTVSYLPSASTLQFLKRSGNFAADKPFVGALGNVSVDGWAPLPGTLVEAAQIQTIYPSVTPVTGAAFTHDVAIHALQTNTEVHFATHGLFDEDAPLFSALLTSPAPGQAARLSLYEVMDLHLKARLVVLSACETNRGRLLGGDEVSGLTRTFLQAGADDVVSSLWKVSDESTALLMQTFHAQLHAGKAPAPALRAAELAVRAKYPAPFYWAAFVNTGVD